MRGDIAYRVYALHEGREQDTFFGAFRSASEAAAEVATLSAKEMNGRNWAEQYHNRGFVVREAAIDTDFEIPSRPKPRDKYAIRGSRKANRPGTWDSTTVEVFRRTDASGDLERICEYERNYAMLQTFEPFRQGRREFALISRNYTKTAVLDLESGIVIAEEADEPGAPLRKASAQLASTCQIGGTSTMRRSFLEVNTGIPITSGPMVILDLSGAVTGATTPPGRSNTST